MSQKDQWNDMNPYSGLMQDVAEDGKELIKLRIAAELGADEENREESDMVKERLMEVIDDERHEEDASQADIYAALWAHAFLLADAMSGGNAQQNGGTGNPQAEDIDPSVH